MKYRWWIGIPSWLAFCVADAYYHLSNGLLSMAYFVLLVMWAINTGEYKKKS